MNRLLLAGALCILGCGTPVDQGDPQGDRDSCASQFDCDPERRRVCEAGYCSALLPRNSSEGGEGEQIYFRSLVIDVTRLRPKQPKALRAFVVYPITPGGRTVTCADIASAEALASPSDFNLTVAPVEQNITLPGDVIRTAIHVNGPGRLLHVTMYDSVLNDAPAVIGTGCIESGSIPETGTIGMTMTRG